MNIHLITIGNKMPTWVTEGYQDYAKRLPSELKLKLVEIPAEKRGKNADIAKIKARESDLLLEAIPKNNYIVALAIQGNAWSTEKLAQELTLWQRQGQDISLLVGGPEGLTESCLTRADLCWSLSPLTFPHPLVRILVAEQLYRAWSINHNHPYHR